MEQEMSEEDALRTGKLLREMGMYQDVYTTRFSVSELLLAYNAVLLKDLRFINNELLAYKQSEAHQ
jgi:hypothetical protein